MECVTSAAGVRQPGAGELADGLPEGTLHAFDTDRNQTACGLPGEDQVVFPHISWKGGLGLELERCAECIHQTMDR